MNNIQEKPTKQESFPWRPAQMVFLVTFADEPVFKKFLSHVSKSMTGTSTSCSLFGALKSLELKWPQPATMQRFPAEKMMRSDDSQVFLLHQLWIVNYFVKSLSNNLSNENIKTGASRDIGISKIVHFGILIHVLSWRQQKNQCLCFHYWYYLTNFWRNNWRFIIDVVERLS